MWNPNPQLLRAYNLGRDDAKSFNSQTNDEILERIYNKND